MAGILQSLGSKVIQVIRHDRILRNFDDMVSKAVTEEIQHLGVDLMKNSNVSTKFAGFGLEENQIHPSSFRTRLQVFLELPMDSVWC